MRWSTTLPSPVGLLTLVASPTALTELRFADDDRAVDAPRDDAHPVLAQAVAELRAYFAGTARTFAVPLDGAGTAFQRDVWRALRDVPFAATCGYGELAARIGRPTASRAVGAANGANPIAIIVPCHRVIGKDGSLTGYGGGMARKQWLLAHEARHA